MCLRCIKCDDFVSFHNYYAVNNIIYMIEWSFTSFVVLVVVVVSFNITVYILLVRQGFICGYLMLRGVAAPEACLVSRGTSPVRAPAFNFSEKEPWRTWYMHVLWAWYMHYDHSTCKYYDHNTCMHCDHFQGLQFSVPKIVHTSRALSFQDPT